MTSDKIIDRYWDNMRWPSLQERRKQARALKAEIRRRFLADTDSLEPAGPTGTA
jgi:hypothetical protein